MKKRFFVILVFLYVGIMLQAQSHKIGEYYGGGIIFSLSADSLHGFIVENIDQSKSCNWNDALIAIKEAHNHNEQGKAYTDWRLPTLEELQTIYKNLKIAQLCSANSTIPVCFAGELYWSSSKYIHTNSETGDYEYDFAHYLKFSDGSTNWTAMGNSMSVRAVREF